MVEKRADGDSGRFTRKLWTAESRRATDPIFDSDVNPLMGKRSFILKWGNMT